MKKVIYNMNVTVEIEVDEEYEAEVYPQGLTKEALDSEMRSEIFDELFFQDILEYKAKGTVYENGVAMVEHHVNLTPSAEKVG